MYGSVCNAAAASPCIVVCEHGEARVRGGQGLGVAAYSRLCNPHVVVMRGVVIASLDRVDVRPCVRIKRT